MVEVEDFDRSRKVQAAVLPDSGGTISNVNDLLGAA
jgi:hypothetical protein